MRDINIYNTLTKKVDKFVPNEPGKVKMYTCGPTVYHFAHIGNLRSYLVEDILEKYLRYAGYDLKRVMNITDVGHLTSDADSGEDKMLKGAKRDMLMWQEEMFILTHQNSKSIMFCQTRMRRNFRSVCVTM